MIWACGRRVSTAVAQLHSALLSPTAGLVLALALAVGGCGSAGPSSSSSAAPSSSTTASHPATTPPTKKAARVAISNFAYTPKTITVRAGTKITWINHDSTAHTATAANHVFDTGTINPGTSRSITVTKAGSYQYICSFHPFMHGTIIVR
jgi:plastocyanin